MGRLSSVAPALRTTAANQTTTTQATRASSALSPACTKTMAASGSINTFVNGLSAGDVGGIPGGTYSGANADMGRSGTAGSRITIESVPGQTAKLKIRMSVTGAFVNFRGLDFDPDHQLGTSNAWVNPSAHDDSFEGNEFAESGPTGTSQHDGQCLYSDFGSSNIRIVRNYFHDCGSLDRFHHSMYLNGTGCTIADNLVLRSRAWGIHLYPELDNSVVANNTVDGSGGVDGYAVTGANTVANSLCDTNRPFCVESGDGFTGSGNVSADPLYVNRAAGDFHVSASSPAVGTANSAYAIGPDKDGFRRPQGGAPDSSRSRGRPHHSPIRNPQPMAQDRAPAVHRLRMSTPNRSCTYTSRSSVALPGGQDPNAGIRAFLRALHLPTSGNRGTAGGRGEGNP